MILSGVEGHILFSCLIKLIKIGLSLLVFVSFAAGGCFLELSFFLKIQKLKLFKFLPGIAQNLFFETQNLFSVENVIIVLVFLPHNLSGILIKMSTLVSFVLFFPLVSSADIIAVLPSAKTESYA